MFLPCYSGLSMTPSRWVGPVAGSLSANIPIPRNAYRITTHENRPCADQSAGGPLGATRTRYRCRCQHGHSGAKIENS